MGLQKFFPRKIAAGLALIVVMIAIAHTKFGREHAELVVLVVYPFAAGWYGWKLYRWQKYGEPIDESNSRFARWYGEAQWRLHLWLGFALMVLAYPVLVLLYLSEHAG